MKTIEKPNITLPIITKAQPSVQTCTILKNRDGYEHHFFNPDGVVSCATTSDEQQLFNAEYLR